jgi:ElaB/YqjD/DUF883 family membrane-anchored ribosome-binding protein
METENIQKPINRISEKYQQIQNRARETAQNTYDTTDTWVRQNPWLSVGIATASALVLGLVLGAMFKRED